MNKNNKNKAYGYARVSTEEQAAEGISLEAQEEKIKAWATLKDLELVEIIKDKGKSGKDMDREGLKKLLSLVEGDEAEAVIVYKLDRLTRRTRDLLFLVEDAFKKSKTRFFSITEQIDTNTALGKFFLTLMGALAQMERELISERTRAALSFKKEQGVTLGHVPYGYSRKDGKLEKNKDEYNVIRKMKRLRKKGKSYHKIAKILNDDNVPTRKEGAQWHASSVYYILDR